MNRSPLASIKRLVRNRPDVLYGKIHFYLGCQADLVRRWLCHRVIHYRTAGRMYHSVLWDEPLIIYAVASHSLHRLPLARTSMILLAVYWSMEEPESVDSYVTYLQTLRRSHPNVRFVVLGNTPLEAELFESRGIEAVFLNHNAFIDERIFNIRQEIPKRFDAIYDAQLEPYKRHYLATGIPNLALISHMYRPSPNMAYAREIRRSLSGASWLNDPLGSSYRRLSVDEVSAALNASRTGLCLSDFEGAMYASCQYLLCGLPVITTPSKGGRDCFFEDDFAITVEAESPAVAAGVAEMCRRQIDRESIRQRTLAKIEVFRDRFVSLVQSHLDKVRPGADFTEHFKKLFFHTLLRNEHPAVNFGTGSPTRAMHTR